MNLIKCNKSFDLILYPLFCSSAVFVKHYPLCLLWMQIFEKYIFIDNHNIQLKLG